MLRGQGSGLTGTSRRSQRKCDGHGVREVGAATTGPEEAAISYANWSYGTVITVWRLLGVKKTAVVIRMTKSQSMRIEKQHCMQCHALVKCE